MKLTDIQLDKIYSFKKPVTFSTNRNPADNSIEWITAHHYFIHPIKVEIVENHIYKFIFKVKRFSEYNRHITPDCNILFYDQDKITFLKEINSWRSGGSNHTSIYQLKDFQDLFFEPSADIIEFSNKIAEASEKYYQENFHKQEQFIEMFKLDILKYDDRKLYIKEVTE